MDRHLFFLLNHEWTHPFLDWGLCILSNLGFWVPFLLLGAFLLCWKQRVRGVACICVCLLGVAVNETLISQPLKTITARARPHQSMEGVRRVELSPASPRFMAVTLPLQVSFSSPPDPSDTKRRSFPSAHVLNATTIGVVLALFFRTPAWLLLLPLMAWSRVYVGAHWPTDVLASLCLGVPWNFALLSLCERFWRGPLLRRYPEWSATYPTLVFPLSRQSAVLHP